ncbi:SusD/RagB family nutrient-binding outer membrane lipoprotein [Parabacteroides sp. AD58]|uniref:SusD/RagB family nutrient-binding outer membrane lipoprotein n=1 Tax=Parabacteroides absconsus TaxID=2951805 RepID=A0ABZ2INY4_9BACT|nr:SusD/RagB family nutrient-binding outer membrane lipoprotein [Parabacteroides sp. AD58]MCM6903538.1 SusD/RagB family nutrient-binding outer membrane lipoprotein [Parabacteroides sp. AD58]
MKLNKILKYTAVSALTLATGVMTVGCTDNFEELNTDPYELNPDALPFSAQFQEPMSYVYAPQQNLFQYCFSLNIDLFSGYFMTPHNFNGSGNVDYALNRGFCGGMYENVYLHIFNNTRRLITSCEEQGFVDYAGMMRVIQAYAIQMLTDVYGPVSYTSAIEDPTNGASFSYDKQEDIYNSMFALLDEAIKNFQNPTSDLTSRQSFDFWCNGDLDLWIKVANQLKLRMAMRIVKANPTLAKQKAEEAAQAGVLPQDILINQGFSNEQTRMFEWGDAGMNANLITIMEGYNDPRLPLYVTKNQADVACEDGSTIAAGTKYLGIRGGCNLPSKPNQWGNFSKIVCSYTTAFPVMKAAEGYFLRAEGILRGWNMGGGTAQQWYEDGIRTSIKNEAAYKGIEVLAGVTSVSDEEINAYINGTTLQEDFVDPVDSQNSIKAQNDVCVKWDESASNEQKLQRIIIQKWIANFPISCEGWAEYRRTGYPKFFPNRVNLSNGTIDTDEQIRRLIYSDNEINTNNAELQKGIELLNQENSSSKFTGDIGGTRVWWDKANVGNF